MSQLFIETAKNVLDVEIQGLTLLKNSFGDAFVQAIDMIKQVSGRVIISGMGKSGHIGQKIAATLASTGTPSFFVHPSEASHGDLGMITQDDLIITISNSGETKEMVDIIAYSRRFKIPLIAITSNIDSTMGKAADLTLLLPHKSAAKEACPLGLAPTTSTTMTLALGDAIAVALMQDKGFSADSFHSCHPGGKLGNILLKCRDIMLKNQALPLVSVDMLMSDALVVMTEKGVGCLGVINPDNQLQGVVTDGDLRRHMAPDLLLKKVGDIMTQNPTVIMGDMLCVQALQLMNEKQITNIFITDNDKKVAGLLTMHLLLQMGVA